MEIVQTRLEELEAIIVHALAHRPPTQSRNGGGA